MSMLETLHQQHRDRLSRMHAKTVPDPGINMRNGRPIKRPPDWFPVRAKVHGRFAERLPSSSLCWKTSYSPNGIHLWSVVYDIEPITLAKIKRIICQHFNLKMVELVSPRRNSALVNARHIAFYLAKKFTSFSYAQIATHFGGRDHTTILHGIQRIEKRLQSQRELAAEINVITEKLQS